MSARVDPSDDPVAGLTDRLMDCRSVGGGEFRRHVIRQLEQRLGYPVPQPTVGQDRIEVYSLADFCLQEPDERLPKLAEAVAAVEGRSDSFIHLERFIAKLLNPGVVDSEPIVRLKEILATVAVPEAEVRRLFAQSVGTFGPELLSTRLADVVGQLNDAMPPAEEEAFPSQLIEFVERLADYLGEDDQAAPDLRRWTVRTVVSHRKALEVRPSDVDQLRRDLGQPTSPEHAANWYLLVEFRPSSTPRNQGLATDRRRYDVSAGLMAESRFVPDFRREEQNTTVSEAEGPVNRWITDASARMQATEPLARRTAQLTIEVFVPLELMDYAFDRWSLSDRPGRELGQAYPMVVRGLDRRRRYTAWQYWKQRWIWLERHPADGVKPVHWLMQTTGLECVPLLNEVTTGAKQRCISLGMNFRPPDQGPAAELLDVGLEAGFPVMVWTRSSGMHNFRAALHAALDQGQFPELPTMVLGLRSQAGGSEGSIGSHLVLLWDNPFRPPPQHSLEGPRIIE
jgi:vWA-MoxR associated protein C-terminal domain/Effector-associated domain 2